MIDKVVETDKAIMRFSFKNQSKEEQDKVFKDIAQACYNLCLYEHKRKLKEDAKTNEDSTSDS